MHAPTSLGWLVLALFVISCLGTLVLGLIFALGILRGVPQRAMLRIRIVAFWLWAIGFGLTILAFALDSRGVVELWR